MRIRFGLASLALVAASAIGAFCGTSSAAHPGSARAESPRVRFGVVADVQYADKSAPGPRQYRASLAKLASCIAGFNRQRLAFVVNLGDLIDGNGERSSQDLAQAVNVLDQLKAPWRHVVGNHCLEVERPALMKALGLKAPYYAFTEPGWRFVVLDGMDVSVKAAKDSPAGRAAQAYLARNPRLATYNGAIGPEQLAWLKGQLSAARQAKQRVLIVCHHPVLPAASEPGLVLWNWEEVLAVVTDAGCVAAWFSGHDHRGGYAERSGIHFVTFPGLVECPPDQPGSAVVEVFANRLVIQGAGPVPSRSLPLRD